MRNELKQLGLTDNESKVYLALLELGENTVGPIIKKLGVHRQIGYDALNSLKDKNMVLNTIRNNRNYFRAASPKNILNAIEEKERLAKRIIPEIETMLRGQKRGQEIKVYEGEKALRDKVFENDYLSPPNIIIYVVSTVIKEYIEMMKRGNLEKSDAIRNSKNIKTMLIFPESQRKNAEGFIRKNTEYRFIKDGFTAPTAFQVNFDSVNIISYGSEMFFIEIKNENFRKTYIEYFNMLWKLAKK